MTIDTEGAAYRTWYNDLAPETRGKHDHATLLQWFQDGMKVDEANNQAARGEH